MNVYLVGGAVRDHLLGLTITERDWVVVGSCTKEMEEHGFIPVGKQFPVYLHPTTHEEYALARQERKTGPGHKGFEVTAHPDISLETDLQRRDLTINAIAQDATGELIDPYGGQTDLHSRVLRHISTAFREDPLRVFRVARFKATLHQFQFSIAPETMDLMREISLSGELSTLPKERIWNELKKALASPYTYEFFSVLWQCKALSAIFPPFANLTDLAMDTLLATFAHRDDLCTEPETKAAIYFNTFAIKAAFSEEDFTHALDCFGLPNSYQKLTLAAFNNLRFLAMPTAKQPTQLLDFILNLDALRNPDRFDMTVRVIFWLNEKILGTRPVITYESMKHVSSSLQKINHQKLRQKHVSKDDFLQALQQLRISVIEDALDKE